MVYMQILVTGNVLTSQRIVDVLLKAFGACAGSQVSNLTFSSSHWIISSQGCMNNTTFGDDSFGYYETVAGGAGAVSMRV